MPFENELGETYGIYQSQLHNNMHKGKDSTRVATEGE